MKNPQKKKNKKSTLIFIPLLLFIFLAAFFLMNEITKEETRKFSLLSSPISYPVKEYPVIDKNLFPEISAKGAVIMDRKSKVVLFSKNPELRFAPASTTKIMTALVALDHYQLSDILIVKKDSEPRAPVKFEKNERVKFEDAIYAMMLPSSNDAAEIISENYPGGKSAFVLRMNEKTGELHLLNTHYEEPVGLLDTKNYTSPKDLAVLASFAMENETFAKVVGTKDRLIQDASGNFSYLLRNLNRLLDLTGITGVKTGYTEEAGQVLVTSKTLDSAFGPQSIIVVVMQSEDRFYDSEVLINTLAEINFLSIHP